MNLQFSDAVGSASVFPGVHKHNQLDAVRLLFATGTTPTAPPTTATGTTTTPSSTTAPPTPTAGKQTTKVQSCNSLMKMYVLFIKD